MNRVQKYRDSAGFSVGSTARGKEHGKRKNFPARKKGGSKAKEPEQREKNRLSERQMSSLARIWYNTKKA